MNSIKVIVWEPGKRIIGAKLQIRTMTHYGVKALFVSYLNRLGYSFSDINDNDWCGVYIHNPIAVVWLNPNALMDLTGHPSWRINETQAGRTSVTFNIDGSIQRTFDSPIIIFNTMEADLTDTAIEMIYDRLDQSYCADNHA